MEQKQRKQMMQCWSQQYQREAKHLPLLQAVAPVVVLKAAHAGAAFSTATMSLSEVQHSLPRVSQRQK
jgi:hypothetical protein